MGGLPEASADGVTHHCEFHSVSGGVLGIEAQPSWDPHAESLVTGTLGWTTTGVSLTPVLVISLPQECV